MTDKKRILIVDDEIHIARIIQITLESAGFDVTVTHDGAEGLRLAKELRPDLIVLDLMLPSIDGYKVCRLLKFDKQYQDIPIILLSAMGESQDKGLGKEVGANLYMSKPFQPTDLVDNVKEQLGIAASTA